MVAEIQEYQGCTKCDQIYPATEEFFYTYSKKKNLRRQCKECCKSASATTWQRMNSDQEWAEARAKRERERYRKDPSKKIAANKSYRDANPEVIRVASAGRCARKYGARSTLTVAEWTNKLEAYEYTCAYCDAAFAQMDHVVALGRGGSNTIDNVVPACISCNRRKRTSTWEPRPV